MRKKVWKLVRRAGPLLFLLPVDAMKQKSQYTGGGCKRCKMVPIYLLVSVLLIAGTSMNACAFLGFGNSASWKEEVLLHDGRKIIVERSQTHGGRGEIGQSPIKEHSLRFTLPGTKKVITWKDEYSEDVGHSNFDLLALHILNDTPYIVTSTYGCLAYNKWGRPNPPYVIFRYEGSKWQRIPLSELPIEFKDINLVVNASAHEKSFLPRDWFLLR